MNLFLFVRQALGLSQEVLASLLGVNLGLLKMAEINRRNLSPDALLRLVWMVDYVKNLTEVTEVTEVKFPADALANLLLVSQKKKRETDRLLEAMETKRKQMLNLQPFQTAFHAKYPAETHISEALWLNAMAYKASAFLDQQNLELELNLRARQAGLAATIDFLEKENK